jgi:hypothetical protein
MLITMTGCMAIPSLHTAVYWLFLADYSQVWSLTQLFIFELSLFCNGLDAGGYQDECNWLLTLDTNHVLSGQASWRVPLQRGCPASPRGYHAACIARVGGNTSSPSTVMLIAGGMCRGRSMID